MKSRTFTGIAFCSPLIVGLIAFTILPVGASLWFSFCNYPILDPPRFVGVANYAEMAHDDQFWHSVRNKLCKVLQISPRDEDQKLNEALAAQEKNNSRSAGMTNLVLRCEDAVNRKDLSDEDLKELVAACDKISEQAEGLLTTSKAE